MLSDVVMPGMKGPEVFARIRQFHPEAKILYMSGYTEGAAISGRLLQQETQFIQKPFTVRGLLEKVGDLLADSTKPNSIGNKG